MVPLALRGKNEIDSTLATGFKSGYRFTPSVANFSGQAPETGFGWNADPISPSAGTRHFFVDQTGVIRSTTAAQASADSPMLTEKEAGAVNLHEKLPHCAQQLHDEAIRCRFCQLWLVPPPPAFAQSAALPPTSPQDERNGSRAWCWYSLDYRLRSILALAFGYIAKKEIRDSNEPIEETAGYGGNRSRMGRYRNADRRDRTDHSRAHVR